MFKSKATKNTEARELLREAAQEITSGRLEQASAALNRAKGLASDPEIKEDILVGEGRVAYLRGE